jgi:hypothetical protein
MDRDNASPSPRTSKSLAAVTLAWGNVRVNSRLDGCLVQIDIPQ